MNDPTSHDPQLCQCGCGEPTPIARQTDRRYGRVAGRPVRYIKGHRPSVHGEARRGSTSSLYWLWCGINRRCANSRIPSWPMYGGRGITVHPPWVTSYAQFRDDVLAEIGPRPEGVTPGGLLMYSLDRIDNDGHYEPGNIRWATPSQQNRNTSQTKLTEASADEIRRLFRPGRGGNAAELAAQFGVSRALVRAVGAGTAWRAAGTEKAGPGK